MEGRYRSLEFRDRGSWKEDERKNGKKDNSNDLGSMIFCSCRLCVVVLSLHFRSCGEGFGLIGLWTGNSTVLVK